MYVMTQDKRLLINIKSFECMSIDNSDASCYTIAGHYYKDRQESVELGTYQDNEIAQYILNELSVAIENNQSVFYMPCD